MIIAISGKIGSGKDLTGKIIQYLTNPFDKDMKTSFDIEQDYSIGNTWQIKKYAYKLKQIVSILTGISVEDLEKEKVKDRFLSGEWDRFYLTKHGTKYFIMEYNDFNWVNFDRIFSSEKEAQNQLDFINKSFGMIINSLKIEKESITVRQLLQEIGTDAMRNVIHPNIWINALFVDYKEQFIPKGIGSFHDPRIPTSKSLGYPNWIITDVRFPNELNKCTDYDCISIRVNKLINEQFLHDIAISSAPFGVGQKMFEDNKKYKHISETALDDTEFDYIIDNNGTIEDLIEKVRVILKANYII
jgi:hypothetical protein